MKKGYKLDHVKLAKRHLAKLSEQETEEIYRWVSHRRMDIAVLKYMDGKLLIKTLSTGPRLLKSKKRFITFRRF